jgi:L-alanine-DL-glutamate epimerase-like enolase superfamily enzyme
MITRRKFVLAGTTLLTAPLFAGKYYPVSKDKTEAGPLIKSITIFKASGNFYRFIGPNSYDKAPKGINGNRPIVKVTLADGTEGIGVVGYREPNEDTLLKIKSLVGSDPLTFYNWKDDKIVSVKDNMLEFFHNATYSWIESAVLDAVGKLKSKPVWRLFGDAVRDGIDTYDGTLYFEEIAQGRDVSIIGEIGKRIKADGYRAIKIKLGRPSKWLPGDAGVQRDIDAFRVLREAVGSNFTLMADANNGYANKFDWSLRLMRGCAPYNMHFMEELFPDDAALYRKLRDALMETNFYIPIADGESINDLKLFDPYLADGVYNYLQPDMHTCGFSNILAFSKKAEAYRQAKVIPHVWQSQVGLIMSLHISRVQKNITYVEDSRYFEHAIIPRGFVFHDGQWFIPETPGWGIEWAPDYKQYITGKETVIQ